MYRQDPWKCVSTLLEILDEGVVGERLVFATVDVSTLLEILEKRRAALPKRRLRRRLRFNPS